MARPIMIQGTMSNAGKSFWRPVCAGFFIRMDTGPRLLNPRICVKFLYYG